MTAAATAPRVYDCRREGRDPAATSFPCGVKIVDPVTGDRIPNVFYASTSPPRLGRFVLGPDGEPLVDPRSRRKVGRCTPDGKEKARIVYDRLEVWEARPWVAVALDGGGVVEKSEGVA